MVGQSLKGHLDTLILAALRADPLHGYAVIEVLRERSGGVFDLPEGTIYPALHRLEQAGLIASRWTDAAGRKRRVYRLTRAGHAAFKKQSLQWSTFSHAVSSVLRTC